MPDLVTQLTPVLVDAASVILMAVITWSARWFQRRTALEIDARHREALHSALMSGINAALSQHEGRGEAARKAIIGAALSHVRLSVPDALEHLAPTEKVLTSIADRYLSEAASIKGGL